MRKLIYSCTILTLLFFSSFVSSSVMAQDENLPGTEYYIA